jgi:hypothetical protein
MDYHCDETSNDLEASERRGRFQDCCKNELWSYIFPKINCTIPGYETVFAKANVYLIKIHFIEISLRLG